MMYFTAKQGFSLVETLVAISILLLVIVGPLTFSTRAANSSSFASEQVQAFFFAQEGLELAQAGRDRLILRNYLPSANPSYIANPWTRFITTTAGADFAACYTANGCGLAWSSSVPGDLLAPIDCGITGTACLLRFNNASVRARFNHTTGTNTLFTRRIYFSRAGLTNNEVQVRSEVTWRTGSVLATQRVEVVSYLYNVYDRP